MLSEPRYARRQSSTSCGRQSSGIVYSRCAMSRASREDLYLCLMRPNSSRSEPRFRPLRSWSATIRCGLRSGGERRLGRCWTSARPTWNCWLATPTSGTVCLSSDRRRARSIGQPAGPRRPRPHLRRRLRKTGSRRVSAPLSSVKSQHVVKQRVVLAPDHSAREQQGRDHLLRYRVGVDERHRLGPEVAASVLPLVVLLEEDHPDESDETGLVREDADDRRPALEALMSSPRVVGRRGAWFGRSRWRGCV